MCGPLLEGVKYVWTSLGGVKYVWTSLGGGQTFWVKYELLDGYGISFCFNRHYAAFFASCICNFAGFAHLHASLYSTIMCLQVKVYTILRYARETACTGICVCMKSCANWGGGIKLFCNLLVGRGKKCWIHLGGSIIFHAFHSAICWPPLHNEQLF